jgi:hypothetical protein
MHVTDGGKRQEGKEVFHFGSNRFVATVGPQVAKCACEPLTRGILVVILWTGLDRICHQGDKLAFIAFISFTAFISFIAFISFAAFTGEVGVG